MSHVISDPERGANQLFSPLLEDEQVKTEPVARPLQEKCPERHMYLALYAIAVTSPPPLVSVAVH